MDKMVNLTKFQVISLASKQKAVRRYGFLVELDPIRHKQEVAILTKDEPLKEGMHLYRYYAYQAFEERLGFTTMTFQEKNKELAYGYVWNVLTNDGRRTV